MFLILALIQCEFPQHSIKSGVTAVNSGKVSFEMELNSLEGDQEQLERQMTVWRQIFLQRTFILDDFRFIFRI